MNLHIPFLKEKKKTEVTGSMTSEAGVAGDEVFGTLNGELERADNISIKDYRKMRDTDGTVESLYNIVTRPILSTTFGIKANEDDIDEEQAEFIRTSLFKQPHLGGMDVPFSLILEQMLHALIDGFEVFERVYKMTDDGKITVKKLALRDATTVKIMLDKKGGYVGIHQEATFGNRTVNTNIPAQKTFLFTYSKADNPWYGRSAFKSCWRNWDKKQKLEYLDSISIQNSAVKPKILKRIADGVIKGEESRKKALKALSELGKLRPAASIPYGFDVEELQGGDNSHINESIERQNSEMARSFMATFSLLGSQGSSSVGSYALSADQSDLFMIALKGIMNLITDHINQYWIADLIDLNYPMGKRHYPEFYFDDLTESNIEFLKGAFTKLIEKDKLSNATIKGLEEKIINKFEIEQVEDTIEPGTDTDNGEDDGSDGGNGEEDEPEPPILPPEAHEKHCACEKEGNGSNAGKFRHRKLVEGEEKVNYDKIEKQAEKIEGAFKEKAAKMLSDYMEVVANNPDKKVELPKEYVDLVRNTYKTSYNYGKMSASDEEGKKAPKTSENEAKHTEMYVDYIVKKQTESIENLIAEQRMMLPLSASEMHAEELGTLGKLIIAAATALVTQMATGTANTIFSNGMNAGRSDAYAVFDEEESATYMWSAYMENTCSVCQDLDGSTYTKKQADALRYQPGGVHIGCRCIWVRFTGENQPKATGAPENFELVNMIQTTTKAELINQGILKDGETKKNALLRSQFNEQNNGNTLDNVEKNIRNKDIEYLAAFDEKGNKLADITSGLTDEVELSDGLVTYLQDNDVSVITHNHPGNSSLSYADISLASGMDIDEIRAVSKKYAYSLKPGEDGWPKIDGSQNEFGRWFKDNYIDPATDEFNILRKRDKALGGLDDNEAWEWITDRAVRYYADDYNLIYNRSNWR